MVATERACCAAAISGAASARHGITTSRLLSQQARIEVSLASRREALCAAHQSRSCWYQPFASPGRPTPMWGSPCGRMSMGVHRDLFLWTTVTDVMRSNLPTDWSIILSLIMQNSLNSTNCCHENHEPSSRKVARTGLARSIYRSRWNARTHMPADCGAGHMSFHPSVCRKTHGRESSAAIMRVRVVYKQP
jgi:hypothetical protein